MNRFVWFVIPTAILTAGCSSERPPATPERMAIEASLARIEIVSWPSTFETGGVVRARLTAAVSSRVLAPVAEVLVRPGDRVRKGQPLVRLDSRELEANASRAEAAVTAAQHAVRAAAFDRDAADAGLRLARATFDRVNTLFATRSATAQERDEASAALGAAEARLAAAEARAAEAEAARTASQAAAEAAATTRSYATINAPFDALVTERAVDPGSLAAPGTPLLTVEDTSALRLEVRLDEARASRLAVGQRADVRFDAAPEPEALEWESRPIVEIARIDPASHSFVVKIDIAADPSLRTGQFGRARFTGPARQVLATPASAVVRHGQLAFVFAVDREGLAHLRPLMLGPEAAGRVEVQAGVVEGESVVIRPPATLVDGSRVKAPATGLGADRTGARP